MPRQAFPPSDYNQTLRHDQLAGHDPGTPWWASLLGVVIAIGIFVAVAFLRWPT